MTENNAINMTISLFLDDNFIFSEVQAKKSPPNVLP